MAATDQLPFFVGAKTKKIVRNYSHFSITLPVIWRCAGEGDEILNGRHGSTSIIFFKWGGGGGFVQKLKCRYYLNFNITFSTI